MGWRSTVYSSTQPWHRWPAWVLAVALIAASSGFVGRALGQAKPPTPPALPVDLNQASLRIHALDTLYDLDLSPAQLKALRAAAANTASTQTRTAAKPNAALAKAFKDFQTALLAAKDDEAIAKLRNSMNVAASDADLDDDVDPTDAAIAAAPAFFRQLKASQIGAYLAVHADQINDPGELILGALDDLRDLKTDGPGAESHIASLLTEAPKAAAYLVYGANTDKSTPLATQVAGFLKAGMAQDDAAYTAQEAARKTAVDKLIGDVDPMVVLGNWLNLRLAELLSNPQLPEAIDITVAARAAAK